MIRYLFLLLCAFLAPPLTAQQSAEFPRQNSFVIHLTSSQFASGYGEYLVPVLLKAFKRTGMAHAKTIKADYALTIEPGMDVGKWYERDGESVWLYRRTITIGLTPAEQDVEPEGRLAPGFAVTTVLLTPNADRDDEFKCLVSLTTRELAARYRPNGHVHVDGTGCARE
ncbi:hypothetical protein RXV86_10335 [Alisedimentitalea sp. MJ-SS2]|uniref:hypothetical protein n=1 Tax=Aliisedimentitalea sp. MJ-SS2 TaxID=3049795 RepID=UPI0029140A74|nr:hypothetical protein [Alisedimentitalea sp. MJ-SS2]MDU8927780.1 hypothetical protein [Alisedimentitalea sp. MJ-SS2]